MSDMDAESIKTEVTQRVILDGKFVRLGGVSAILAMVLLMAGIYTHIFPAGAPSPPDGMEVYLTIINDNPAANMLSSALNASAYLLLLVFMVALYQLFRDGGGFMRLALVSGTFGLVLLTFTMILSMLEVELAAQYVAADGATQTAVAVMVESLLRLISLVDLIGNLLAWGVAGSIYSVAILRTSILSRWLGYGGLVYAGVFLATTIEVAAIPDHTARDSIIFALGTFYGIIWIIAMGVSLLRVDVGTVE